MPPTPVAVAPFGIPDLGKFVTTVGVSGVIALLFVWFTMNTLPKLQGEVEAARLESERMRLAVQQQTTQNEQIYRMLQRICSNSAKSDEERSRCFDR